MQKTFGSFAKFAKFIRFYSLQSLAESNSTRQLLTSCSDSKDDEPKNGDSVVGVWRSEFSAGYQLLTLEKSGRYSLFEYDSESGNWSEHGTYTVKNNVMTMVASDGEIEVLSILTITSKKMILRYEGEYVGQYPDGEIETWTREE